MRTFTKLIDWDRYLRQKNPNQQIKFLNEWITNVFNNYCPNKIITCNDQESGWKNTYVGVPQ